MKRRENEDERKKERRKKDQGKVVGQSPSTSYLVCTGFPAPSNEADAGNLREAWDMKIFIVNTFVTDLTAFADSTAEISLQAHRGQNITLGLAIGS